VAMKVLKIMMTKRLRKEEDEDVVRWRWKWHIEEEDKSVILSSL